MRVVNPSSPQGHRRSRPLAHGHPRAAFRAARSFHSVLGKAALAAVQGRGPMVAPRHLLDDQGTINDPPAMGTRRGSSDLRSRERRAQIDMGCSCTCATPTQQDSTLISGSIRFRASRPPIHRLDLRVVTVASRWLCPSVPRSRGRSRCWHRPSSGNCGSRVKMSFVPYYCRLARQMHRAYRELFAEDSIACRRGFVAASGPRRDR